MRAVGLKAAVNNMGENYGICYISRGERCGKWYLQKFMRSGHVIAFYRT